MTTIKPNTFAEACYETNSPDDLREMLGCPADPIDMQAWGLTAVQWREEIRTALRQMEADAKAQQKAWAAGEDA